MPVRSSGILLHPTSLPSRFGIGDLGPEAYRFADLLAEMGQQYWQVLPVNVTDPDHGHSPYHCLSAFAGDPLWISPRLLAETGWLTDSDLKDVPDFPAGRVEFVRVRAFKMGLLEKAFVRFKTGREKAAVVQFFDERPWLSDFALFRVLTQHHGRPWSGWPRSLRDREPDALSAARRRFREEMWRETFFQYLFFQQWTALKHYCNRRRVHLIGDMPIYLPFHSADVWGHPHLYKLSRDRSPLAVSGVPPDYFSRTGQLWGHPVYDWEALSESGFHWWMRRTEHNLNLFDQIRIDHFRGWVACWEVPGDANDATAGKWVPVPGEALLETLFRRFGRLPFIAEDLGTITADVRETMARFDLPGMRVLQFAFGDDFPNSAFLPHNHVPHCVAYTGTHDNNTVRGWYTTEAGDQERDNVAQYLGRKPHVREVHWEMIRLTMASVAETAIVPLQDLLGLEDRARMNNPAVQGNNWRWRAPHPLMPVESSGRFKEMTWAYGRAPAQGFEVK